MEIAFLNFGNIQGEALAALPPDEYTAYICAQPIAPVFSCDTCHKEQKIPGMEHDWLNFFPKAPEPVPEIRPVAICPHCRQPLPSQS